MLGLIILPLVIALVSAAISYDLDLHFDFERVTSAQIGSVKCDCAPATLAAAVIRVEPENEKGEKIPKKEIIDKFKSCDMVFDNQVRTVISLLNKDKNNNYTITLYENQLRKPENYPNIVIFSEKRNKANFDFKKLSHENIDFEYYYPYNFDHSEIYEFMKTLKEKKDLTGMYLSGTLWGSENSKWVRKAGHAVQPIAINEKPHEGSNKEYTYYNIKYYDPTLGISQDSFLAQETKGVLLVRYDGEKWYQVDTLLFIEKIPEKKKEETIYISDVGDTLELWNQIIEEGDNNNLFHFQSNLNFGLAIPYCGDGTKNGAEECDHGQNNGVDGLCDKNCKLTYCGDGKLQSPNGKNQKEKCDDGNNANNDKCNNNCELTYCGDGITQSPNGKNQKEKCDDGQKNGRNAKCNSNCELTYCGDGIVQRPNGQNQYEQCDDGNNANNDKCNNKCELTYCGDGILQKPNGREGWIEECDGNAAVECGGWPYDCNHYCDCVLNLF